MKKFLKLIKGILICIGTSLITMLAMALLVGVIFVILDIFGSLVGTIISVLAGAVISGIIGFIVEERMKK